MSQDYYEAQDEMFDELYRALRARAVVLEWEETMPHLKRLPDVEDPVYRILDRLAEHDFGNPDPQELSAFLVLASRVTKLHGTWLRHFGDDEPLSDDPVGTALLAFVNTAVGLLAASEEDDAEYHRIALARP